jgi:protein Mpv17
MVVRDWLATSCLLTRSRFLFLGNHFNYSSQILSIATKVAVQQAVFTPVFNTYFFGMQAILTGEQPSGIINRIQKAVPVSIKNSLKLWPAVTAFSFAFIMPQYRFMFSGIFAVLWQGYLSFLNRKEEKTARKIGIN